MNKLLEEKFYDAFQRINALQNEIEKETADTPFSEIEERRNELLDNYLLIGERDKSAIVLSNFLEKHCTPENYKESRYAPKFFSEMHFLTASAGKEEDIRSIIDSLIEYLKVSDSEKGDAVMEMSEGYIKLFGMLHSGQKDEMLKCADMLKKWEEEYDIVSGAQESDLSLGILVCHSRFYELMGNYEKAIDFATRALDIFDREGRLLHSMEILRRISGLYELSGDYPTALKYYDKYCSLRSDMSEAKDYAYSRYLINLYGLASKEIQTNALREGNKDLAVQIMRDQQTGMLNRRFYQKLKDENFIDGDNEDDWGAIMFDIDYFKRYNDNYGHIAGDEALFRIGTILTKYETDNIFPIRYGGEEFLVILKGVSAKETRELAENVLEDLRKLRIRHSYSLTAKYMTMSAGFSCGRCRLVSEFTDLCIEADQALYASKEQGKNRCTEYRR